MRIGQDHVAARSTRWFWPIWRVAADVAHVPRWGAGIMARLVNFQFVAEEIVPHIGWVTGIIAAVPLTNAIAILFALSRFRRQMGDPFSVPKERSGAHSLNPSRNSSNNLLNHVQIDCEYRMDCGRRVGCNFFRYPAYSK